MWVLSGPIGTVREVLTFGLKRVVSGNWVLWNIESSAHWHYDPARPNPNPIRHFNTMPITDSEKKINKNKQTNKKQHSKQKQTLFPIAVEYISPHRSRRQMYILAFYDFSSWLTLSSFSDLALASKTVSRNVQLQLQTPILSKHASPLNW